MRVTLVTLACVALAWVSAPRPTSAFFSDLDYAATGNLNPDAANQAPTIAYKQKSISYCTLKDPIRDVGSATPTPTTTQPEPIYAKNIRLPCGPSGDFYTIAGSAQLRKHVQASSDRLAPQVAAYNAANVSFNSFADLAKPYDYFHRPDGLTGSTTDAHFARLRQTYYAFHLRKAKPADLDDLNGIVPASHLLAMRTSLLFGRLYVEDYEADLKAAGMWNNPLLPKGHKTPPRRAFFTNQLLQGTLQVEGILIRNTWSTPSSPPAQWYLAKAFANMVLVNLIPLDHFLDTHLLSGPIEMATERCTADNHIVRLLIRARDLNAGLVRDGERGIFNTGVGNYDAISQWGAAAHHIHYNSKEAEMTWLNRTFARDMERRGLQSLTGFEYRNYMERWDAIFQPFFSTILRKYYPTDADVASDAQLQCIFREAGNRTSNTNPTPGQGQLFGFPQQVGSLDLLVDVMTHLWMSVVKHGAMNLRAYYHAQMLIPTAPYRLKCEFPEVQNLTSITESWVVKECMPTPSEARQMIQAVEPYDRAFSMQDSMLFFAESGLFGTGVTTLQAVLTASLQIQALEKIIQWNVDRASVLPYDAVMPSKIPNNPYV